MLKTVVLLHISVETMMYFFKILQKFKRTAFVWKWFFCLNCHF